ncbi:TolC family protein, partial [Parabacteroides distasonis]
MKKTILSLLALTAIPVCVSAQWDVRRCISHAIANNISIKQADNRIRQNELQLSTAKNSRLPDLSASVGENISFGRGLTAENTYSNTNTSSTSFGLSTSIPLFTGMR